MMIIKSVLTFIIEKQYKYFNNLTKKIQLVYVIGDPRDYIETFDLDCCKIYYDPVDIEFKTKYSEDILNHKTHVTNYLYQDAKKININRLLKYSFRGFTIYLGDTNINLLIEYNRKLIETFSEGKIIDKMSNLLQQHIQQTAHNVKYIEES